MIWKLFKYSLPYGSKSIRPLLSFPFTLFLFAILNTHLFIIYDTHHSGWMNVKSFKLKAWTTVNTTQAFSIAIELFGFGFSFHSAAANSISHKVYSSIFVRESNQRTSVCVYIPRRKEFIFALIQHSNGWVVFSSKRSVKTNIPEFYGTLTLLYRHIRSKAKENSNNSSSRRYTRKVKRETKWTLPNK